MLCLKGSKDSRLCQKPSLLPCCKDSAELTGVAANRAAADLIDAIVKELKSSGGFTLPSFGTFRVAKTKARKALNPRTGEPVKVKAGKTVRFKVSPSLKKLV
jgi:DNA-binding protein HU-beta